MCAVSQLQQYFDPRQANVQPQQWTLDTWGQYREILAKLADLDRKLGQPNCEDPAKAAWMADVERRLGLLEGAKA